MHWVYSVVHSGVVSHEVDNLIWVILCGFQVGGKSASRTLVRNQKFLLSNLLVYLIHGSSNIYVLTHSARSRVGDFPSVWHPLIVRAFLVGKWPIKDHTDVSHRVHTHCRAFKHRSGGGQEEKKRKGEHIKTAARGFRFSHSLG